MSKVKLNLDKLFAGALEKPTVLTAEQVKQKETILFPATKEDLRTKYGLLTQSDKTHGIFAKVGEQEKLVNVCSSSYGYKHISEIINPIEDELFKKFNVTPKYHVEDESKFHVKYTLEDGDVTVSNNDKMKPYIVVRHSYDGKIPLQLTYGFYRLVCSNGMVVADTKIAIKMRHGINKMLSSPSMIENFIASVVEDIPEYTAKYQVLTDRKVTDIEKRIDIISEATSFPKRFTSDIQGIVQREVKSLDEPFVSDWLVYSAFNNVLNHNNVLKMDTDKRIKVDNDVFEYMLTTA